MLSFKIFVPLLGLPSQEGLVAVVPGAVDAQRLSAIYANQRVQPFGKFQIIPFELLLVIFLIHCDEILVLLQGIIASADGKVAKTVFLQFFRKNLLFREVLKAQAKFVLFFGYFGVAVCDGRQEHQRHLHWTLVYGCANAALQDHLQNFRISRFLVGGRREFGGFLLDVFDGHLDGLKNDLLATDNLYAGLHRREVTSGGQNGLSLVLLVQFSVGLAGFREGRRVNEAIDIEIPFEMGFALAQLKSLEVRLYESDLQVDLLLIEARHVNVVRVLDDDDIFSSEATLVEHLKSVEDFRQLCERWLLVNELVLVQVAQL